MWITSPTVGSRRAVVPAETITWVRRRCTHLLMHAPTPHPFFGLKESRHAQHDEMAWNFRGDAAGERRTAVYQRLLRLAAVDYVPAGTAVLVPGLRGHDCLAVLPDFCRRRAARCRDHHRDQDGDAAAALAQRGDGSAPG